MAVKEQEFYHGAVLNRLFKTKKSINISVFPNSLCFENFTTPPKSLQISCKP